MSVPEEVNVGAVPPAHLTALPPLPLAPARNEGVAVPRLVPRMVTELDCDAKALTMPTLKVPEVNVTVCTLPSSKSMSNAADFDPAALPVSA